MFDVHKSLLSAGVLSHDTVMIHADAGVAAQFVNVDGRDRLNFFIDKIVTYFAGEGTIVVPTFSYSFTKGDDFYVDHTPSDVGLFSEAFRKISGALRSSHPIFSVASLGKNAKDFQDSRIDDCFGLDTAFDLLLQKNAKILCLGCNFSRITFSHYIEQAHQVSYRYMKEFKGEVISSDRRYQLTTSYYVRDTSINSECDLDLLKEVGINQQLVYAGELGRFPFFSVNAVDLYKLASDLLAQDKYALIKQRFFI